MTVRVIGAADLQPQDTFAARAAWILDHLIDPMDVEVRYRVDTRAQPPDAWARSFDLVRPAEANLSLFDTDGRIPKELAIWIPIALRTVHEVSAAEALLPQAIGPHLTTILGDWIVARAVASVAQKPNLEPTIVRTLGRIADLAVSSVENEPVAHGVLIGGPSSGNAQYDQIPQLRRLPHLFDGQSAALWIADDGTAIGDVTSSNVSLWCESHSLDHGSEISQVLAAAGSPALVPQASRCLKAVGIELRPDRSVWVYVDGDLVAVERDGVWRMVPYRSFAESLERLHGRVGRLVADASLLLSRRDRGGILAISPDDVTAIDRILHVKDPDDHKVGTLGWTLRRIIDVSSPDVATIARLAAIDGATVLNPSGDLVTFGAVVGNAGGPNIGARSSAARELSRHARLTVKVSEDGPIEVYIQGHRVATLM